MNDLQELGDIYKRSELTMHQSDYQDPEIWKFGGYLKQKVSKYLLLKWIYI